MSDLIAHVNCKCVLFNSIISGNLTARNQTYVNLETRNNDAVK